MKIIKVNFKKIKNKEIDLIVNYLNSGKVIAYPTDTIYGLGCVATSRKAINKIHKIKKSKKPFLILVSSLKMLEKYCHVDARQKRIMKRIEEPTTFILKSKGKLPKELSGGTKNLAVRLPQSNFLIKLIKKNGLPIVSTSLNISGKKPLDSVNNLEKYFKKDKPDLVVNAGRLIRVKPSKIVDIRDINKIKILRK